MHIHNWQIDYVSRLAQQAEFLENSLTQAKEAKTSERLERD